MKSKSICPLPWVHLATYTDGSVLPCCVAKNSMKLNLNQTSLEQSWNSAPMRELRIQLLNSEKPDVCSRCWEEEASGYKSHRLSEIEAWERLVTQEGLEKLYSSTQPDGELEGTPLSYDLRVGNTCNLQCIMCRPQESVKWFGLAQKIQELTEDPTLKGDMDSKLSIDRGQYQWSESPEFWQGLRKNISSVRELIFGGGEPLIWAKHPELIEECVRSGHASQIQLRYHTNLTVLDKDLFELWKSFKKVEVFASVDGLGERNFYLRHPANWEAIERNLTILEESAPDSVLTMILYSVHALSFYDMDLFANWLQDQKFKRVTHGFNGYFHPGLVMEPKFLSTQVLPLSTKEKIKEKILKFESQSLKPSHKMTGVLNYMFEKDQSHLLPVLRDYISLLDRVRKTSFSETFPDLARELEI